MHQSKSKTKWDIKVVDCRFVLLFISLSRTWTNANSTESFLFVLRTQQAYQPVVMFQLIPEKPLAVEKLVTYRKYRSIDMESFKNDLVTSSLCQPPLTTETPVYGVDKLAKDYNSTLRMLIDCHAPLKSKTVKARPSVPWYISEIGAAKSGKAVAENWQTRRPSCF